MIRKFKIYNKKFKEVQAYVQYNTDTKQFSMQLLESYEGMHPDCIFAELHKMGYIEVPQKYVDMWVKSRVITPDRQGMSGILKELGLKEYDRFQFFLLGHGESQMDFSCAIEITDENDKVLKGEKHGIY